jgi:hypothetical protein
MSVQLYGRKNIREFRENIQKQILECAADPQQKIDEVRMHGVIEKLMNHIEDLETFVCDAADVDYSPERVVNKEDAHFDKDLFNL